MKQIYITKNGSTKVFLVSLLLTMMSFTAFSQNSVYSTIAKNINPDAKSLHHELNKAGDTLHLKSDFNLYKVEFLGSYESKVFEIKGSKSEAYIPLASVPVGEYTIAAFQIERSDEIYQYQKTIIFRVSRLLPILSPVVEEEELIAEAIPEIIKDEPIIKEETKVAVVEKPEPPKKEKVKTQPKKKTRVVKRLPSTNNKTRVVNRVPRPKKKTRVASNTSKTKSKSFVESVKQAREKKVVRTKPEKPARVVETKEPKLDTTEYKSYNISTQRGGQYVVQSREEYRSQNPRPNGKPYNK